MSDTAQIFRLPVFSRPGMGDVVVLATFPVSRTQTRIVGWHASGSYIETVDTKTYLANTRDRYFTMQSVSL